MPLNRRHLLLAAALLPVARAAGAQPSAEAVPVHVRKDPSCGCCGGWVEHLRAAGYPVTVEEMEGDLLADWKLGAGVPADLVSCHTAEAGGYLIEGHVPAADLARLLAERPAALGLAVPGMPYGAPGMGPESERDAYDVILFRADGTSEVWTAYPAAA